MYLKTIQLLRLNNYGCYRSNSMKKTLRGQVSTNKTSGTIRFKTVDSEVADTANPIPIPASGSNFSFEKWLRLTVTVAPTTQIDNLLVFSDGANGLGTGISVHHKIVGTFATPTQPVNSVGFTDFFALTSGVPGNADATNVGPFTGTGDIGDYLVLLMEVASTAVQGATPTEQITFSYDES